MIYQNLGARLEVMRIFISIGEVRSPLSSTKYLSESALSEALYFYPESAQFQSHWENIVEIMPESNEFRNVSGGLEEKKKERPKISE